MTLGEHVYYVAVAFKISEHVEQQICIKFCVKLELSFMEIIWMIQKPQLWVSQHACSCITSQAECFGKISDHPGDSTRLQPRFGALQILAFPKIKITSERALAAVVQWNRCQPANQSVASLIPSQGTCLSCRPGPQ